MESARCKAFIESVDCGSFRAAAESLGYTPSAVSQLVAALERDLGLTLLIRSKQGVKPTAEGMRLIPIARSYLAREREMYELADELQGLSVGSITIAAYPSVATTWLPELVRTFQRDYPDIQFNIMEGIRPEIFHHLDQHEADMGFLAYAEPMDYEWIPLAEEEIIAAIPEHHRLADAKAYPVSESENDDFIMTSWGKDMEIEEIFRANNVSPTIKYTTYDTPATLAMVRMGLGVSFVNELSAQYWNEHLVKLPLDPPHKVTFGIAYVDEGHMTIAARKFLDYAVKYLTRAEKE
ncbi:MAG: LysR family transcriptional regulator [Clostridiales bacterium]|jgi:DNA-binding transcriptional LysR family regulator|nr:LysR family transcriptional regulator [Clostridiales bacterium]